MKKQIKIAALAGAAILSAAAMANAAPAQLNIYGASAQGDFWVSEAYPFLTSLGCKAADGKTALPTGDAANGKIALASGTKVKYGYAVGFNCTSAAVPVNGVTGTKDLEIRTAGIASLEGPLAVSVTSDGATPPTFTDSLPLEPDAACSANGGNRLMANNATIAAVGDLGCYRVHVGTTDLDVANINQSATDGAPNFNNYPMPDPPVTAAGLGDDTALVVPFSFAVNTNVKARHCYDTTGGVSTKMSGFYCTDVSQCGAPLAGHTRSCNAVSETIDNLSRNQVAELFSGQVGNWKTMNDAFDSLAVTVCLRQPGSGTQAAFEKTVMTAGDTGWGPGIAADKVLSPAAGKPYVDYVKSSDNMVDCINNTGALANRNGAVGFVDGDKNGNTLAANAVKVNYNGAFPSRINVRNGVYDFYSVGHLYTRALAVPQSDLYPLLRDFAKNPRNIPGTVTNGGACTQAMLNTNPLCAQPWTLTAAAAGAKATWWATADEMKYTRGSADLTYPGAGAPVYNVKP